MLTNKKTTQLSKFLSLILRHKPETINATLDSEGWISVEELLDKIKAHGQEMSRDELNHIVETNSKKRFAFDASGTKIRASQGHSIAVNLGYEAQAPPTLLYHGTATKHVDAILKEGLDKRNRQHVHLSADLDTARQVGQRHGKVVILKVQAQLMHTQGYKFFLSKNGVWLTDKVPVEFIGQ